MKRNIIETVLGAVVLFVAAFFLVYSSTAANIGTGTGGYKVGVEFSEIGGLKSGADVRISGVKIGSVAAVDLDPTKYLAEVTLLIDQDIKLPIDTAARISSESLLGGTYLALDPGAEEEMIADGGRVRYAQDATNLEQLLGKFIFTMADSKKGDDTASAQPATATTPSAGTAAQPEADAAEATPDTATPDAAAEPAHP